MIVWLASYPRSGNTLFRTICRHCYGRYSYADEPVDYESEFRSNPDLIGHVEYSEPWEEFYRKATASSDIFLVKTHNYPIDDQPYIYIVRDGRSSIQSYRNFHRSFNRIDKSLVSIILGVDSYGDWSTHFDRWNSRDTDGLMVRFEDLVDVSGEKLDEIAGFIRHPGNIEKWENPVQALQAYEPNFFNEKSRWFKPNQEWTPSIDFIFYKRHYELMSKLNYDLPDNSPASESERSCDKDAIVDELIALIDQLNATNTELMQVCHERKALIDKLHDVCEQRLEIINKFHQPDK